MAVRAEDTGIPLKTTRHDKSVSAIGISPKPAINEYELHVFPDEHSIVNDDLFKCTPYIVNIMYMVLICTDCRYCILPDRALEHLRKDHPYCKVGTDFLEQLSLKFPGLVAETIHPPEAIEPVFGLAIPPEKYTICTRCRRGYVNADSLRRHVCGNIDADLAGQPEHFLSFVQTFFRGPRICYFSINLPTPVSGEAYGDDFDLFKSALQELTTSEDELDGPEDYRELNQFLLKEGWINHVSGCSASELSLLTAPPKEGELLRPVARQVIALMSNIQTAIGTAGYHVRRLLGKRPA